VHGTVLDVFDKPPPLDMQTLPAAADGGTIASS
jgi:hypothetical protein